MIDIILDADSSVFLFINSLHCAFFDSFMSIYSGRFIWIPMYAALLLMMVKRYPLVKTLCLLVGIALSITLADQICASVIRPIFERLRPSNLDNPLSEFTHIVNGYRGGAYGFPSCHAANSFALAVFAATMLRQRGFTIFILVWAFINCYSRIYLGVHYPGDIIVGALIGSAIGYLCCIGSLHLYKMFFSDKSQPIATLESKDFILGIKGMKWLNLMEIVAFITIIYIIIASIVA